MQPVLQPKVSIVIPVYNVEKYLTECLVSVVSQTLREIEVICVNDGSTDKSGEILAHFASTDSRVKVFTQENGGYGAAVNKGVSEAKGEFVAVLESDDFIDTSMYEKLYTKAVETGAELVKCNFCKYDSQAANPVQIWKTHNQDLTTAPDGVFSPVSDYSQIFSFHSSLWANLYRAELIKSVRLFDERGTMYQDFPFAMEVYAKTKKMAVVKEMLHYWRNETGQNNSTQAKNPEKLLKMADMSKVALEVLRRYGLLERLKEEFFLHVAVANYGFYYQQNGAGRKVYAEKLREIFAFYTEAKFSFFEGYLEKWTTDIMRGKTPRLSFKQWKRRFFSFRVRGGKIFVKVGKFEKTISI